MNNLQIFENTEFGKIRTVQLNNETYFAGKDVADILGYQNGSRDINRHVDEEDKHKIMLFDGNQDKETIIINESGLYSLILSSKMPNAKKFKHWVTSEVLPQIRKTGAYQKPLTQQEIMRIQLGMIDDHEERIINLENNMTIDYGQQQVLGDVVNKTVIDILGGKDSAAYREISKRVFSECNRDLKHYFHVNARNNVPKKRFDEAVEYAKNWQPYEKRLNTINRYIKRGKLDEDVAEAMKKLAKDKMLRAKSNVAYAKGAYEKEMEQAALLAEAKM